MPSPFVFGPGKQPDSGTNNPPLTNDVANTASAIYAGSILGYSSNILVALATTPTAATIVGVAASDNNTAPGYNMANQPTNVGFRSNIVPFYRATTDTLYEGHMTNGSDTYVTPVLSDVGVSYGLRVTATGEVTIDRALTTTDARVKVLRLLDVPNKIVEVSFLATAILP